jgi:hypothetical protein
MDRSWVLGVLLLTGCTHLVAPESGDQRVILPSCLIDCDSHVTAIVDNESAQGLGVELKQDTTKSESKVQNQ